MQKTCLKGTFHCEYNGFLFTTGARIKISLHYVATCYQFDNHLECLPSTQWLLILSDELPNLIQNCLNEPEFICNKTFLARNNYVAL